MNLFRSALEARCTGMRDSSLNAAGLASDSRHTTSSILLSSEGKTVIEETVVLFAPVDESGVRSGRRLLKRRAAVLCSGEVRPYTADEVQATAGNELASGKAVHLFIGHYRQSTAPGSLQEKAIKEGSGRMYFADGSFFLGNWVNNHRCDMRALYSSFGYAY
ncbi:phosphatidylinositol-4-phosphate 5-kinase [Trypanosoma conorhini]|uniref:Phosphatidylinositol-4-phosphate 5-kinase n=1 Tax=Trypanosoma conorhini TaxID=83891 RepID=A0A3S5IUG3_9TRYP|nr:phosphatidylinositol-4-phosphate 5-kinase [Trypanosoma conorhini]RNF25660.1 phosphatidylinositol-4-phosphate 5-kinase [Trypanosoma conorhini]